MYLTSNDKIIVETHEDGVVFELKLFSKSMPTNFADLILLLDKILLAHSTIILKDKRCSLHNVYTGFSE